MMEMNTIPSVETAQQSEEPVRTCPKMTLTVDVLAEELNISRNTAYNLADRKDFPSFRVGRRLLVNRALLQEWMDQNSRPEAKTG